MKVPGPKMSPTTGFELYKYIKNDQKSCSSELLGSNACIFVSRIACLVVPYQVCSNNGPLVQDGPAIGVLGSKHRNT